MADIEVNSASISQMEKNVRTGLEHLKASIKNVHAGVEELNKTWEGPNHETFEKAFLENYADMTKLEKMLEHYADSLKKAAKTYRECEKEVAQIVRRQ